MESHCLAIVSKAIKLGEVSFIHFLFIFCFCFFVLLKLTFFSQELLQLRNFQGVFEIIGGFFFSSCVIMYLLLIIIHYSKHPPLGLTHTITERIFSLEKLPEKLKKRFFILKEYTISTGNFKKLREALEESQILPSVPYIGLYLSDLTFTYDGLYL